MNTEPVDPAVQAFEALRGEIAVLKPEITTALAELLAIVIKPAPDYDLTLGRIAKQLVELTARVAAVEGKPAMTFTARSFGVDLQALVREAGDIATDNVRLATRDLEQQVEELQKATGHRIGLARLPGWFAASGGLGLLVGIALCLGTVAALPQQAEAWIATAIIGGGPWKAGQVLMRLGSQVGFDRMARLNEACGDELVDLCEAAITIRTMPPLLPVPAPSIAPRDGRDRPAAVRRP